MTGGESVFSCIKQTEPREEAPRYAPPPAAASAPPLRSAQNDELTAKVSALEAKIKKLEEKDAAAAAAAESFKAEAQAAQRRVAELERASAEFRKMSEAFPLSLWQFKEEVTALRARAVSMEEIIRRLDPSTLNAVALSVDLFEGRLKSLETGLANELKERFSALDAALSETSLKTGLAQEIAAGSARRVEKLGEMVVRLPYLENRLSSSEGKLERINELEALAQSLKLSVEGMENNFSASMRESVLISEEHKKILSDFESVSRQVKQLTALFNQFRTELAFLMPKKRESIGG